MSVTIRLARIGKRNAPSFKIVATNTRSKRNGRYLDILGHFNPSHTPALVKVDEKKLNEWKANGAIVSKAVSEIVDGKYEFQPYTRQNEAKEEVAAPTAPAAETAPAEAPEAPVEAEAPVETEATN